MWSWEKWILIPLKMNQTNPLLTIPLYTIPHKTPRKLISKVQSNIIETQSTYSKKPWVITFSNTPSHPAMRKVHKTLPNSFPE